MSIRSTSTVLPIQRAMASCTPARWRDGFITQVRGAVLSVALLDGDGLELVVTGAPITLAIGTPVAHHAVAEILSTGDGEITAREVASVREAA